MYTFGIDPSRSKGQAVISLNLMVWRVNESGDSCR
jgi:hypothetical protein